MTPIEGKSQEETPGGKEKKGPQKGGDTPRRTQESCHGERFPKKKRGTLTRRKKGEKWQIGKTQL